MSIAASSMAWHDAWWVSLRRRYQSAPVAHWFVEHHLDLQRISKILFYTYW
jgi:hypothetical protein